MTDTTLPALHPGLAQRLVDDNIKAFIQNYPEFETDMTALVEDANRAGASRVNIQCGAVGFQVINAWATREGFTVYQSNYGICVQWMDETCPIVFSSNATLYPDEGKYLLRRTKI